MSVVSSFLTKSSFGHRWLAVVRVLGECQRTWIKVAEQLITVAARNFLHRDSQPWLHIKSSMGLKKYWYLGPTSKEPLIWGATWQ